MCHRDLKLENILLDSEMNIKIIDFGLSNILNDAKLKTACGSPSYASPEMLSGKRYQGPLIDIWATGIILYAMVCGFLPFDDEKVEQLYKKIISGKFEIPDHVSPSAADLIRKILVTDPEKRITIPEILEHEWYLTANKEQAPKPVELDAELIIDFKIIYTMVNSLPNWSAVKVIKALNANRHNQMTATYYLLSEKRAAENPGKEWNHKEQQQYAAALGLELTDDG